MKIVNWFNKVFNRKKSKIDVNGLDWFFQFEEHDKKGFYEIFTYYDVVIRRQPETTLYSVINDFLNYNPMNDTSFNGHGVDETFNERIIYVKDIENLGDSIIGFLVYEVYYSGIDKYTLEIKAIYVHPEYRRLGIGKKMVKDALNITRNRPGWGPLNIYTSQVSVESKEAIGFFKSIGMLAYSTIFKKNRLLGCSNKFQKEESCYEHR